MTPPAEISRFVGMGGAFRFRRFAPAAVFFESFLFFVLERATAASVGAAAEAFDEVPLSPDCPGAGRLRRRRRRRFAPSAVAPTPAARSAAAPSAALRRDPGWPIGRL
jgi:hypothetical protein